MPLSKQITETIHVEEEVIERIPVTTYVEKKKIVIKEKKREVLNHKEVVYNNNKYIVGYCLHNDDDILFVFDHNKKEDVITRKWHKKDNFISSVITDPSNKKTKQLHLHNFVIDDKENFIDHINKIGYDNRLENLRKLNQIEFNFNQSKTVSTLPANSEINIKDIPKYISYRKADTTHGDKFMIDIQLSSSNINWQTTTSKNVSTKIKLNDAVLKLKEFYNTNKEFKELNDKINNYKKQNELKKSFNEILLLSGYPIEIINKNLISLEPEKNQDIEVEEINENNEYINEIKPIIEQKTVKKIKGTVHSNVEYNNKKYTVGFCSIGKENALFVIDYENRESITNTKWHYNKETKYIYSSYIDNEGVVKFLYQHIYMIYGLELEQDHAFSIDHINQIGRDNRLENLRKLTISHQNINRGKLKRNIELPEGCGINPQDIPTNIYYRKPQGLHGDRFYVEIKYSDPPFLKDSTSSKSIDLKTKLQQAILILEEYKRKNPEYAMLVDGIKNVDNRNDLRKSFNEIIKLSGFPQEIIEQNLVPVEDETEVIEDHEAQDLAKQLIDQGYKNITSSLPLNCGVTPDMIPKYCYYKPAKDKRGDKFIIERHPKLTEKGVRQWATTESKTKTTKEKFDLLIEKYKELEK
jgi:hypothetical protein